MLSKLFDSDTDRGQVGIGTLIVFIAMVLVAAVAAGVLVNTAGLLQGQSEATGQDAQAEVSNNIDVVSADGDVDSATDQVSAINLVTKKSAGSDALDLESATIQYSSSDTSTTLLHGAETSDVTGLGSPGAEFGTENVDSSAGASDTVLSETEDRITVVIDASAVDNSGGLDAGETATLRVVDQSGATKTVELNVPQVTSDKSSVQL